MAAPALGEGDCEGEAVAEADVDAAALIEG